MMLDLDQFLFDKRSKLEHFFGKVHEELSSQSIFSLHFFLKFSKHLARREADEHSLDLLRRAFKQITKDDIEVFLFYETDLAVQIVTDLLETNPATRIQNLVLVITLSRLSFLSYLKLTGSSPLC